MKDSYEQVFIEIDGKVYKVRKVLLDTLEGKVTGEIDDEFRKTFTEAEKEVILKLMFYSKPIDWEGDDGTANSTDIVQ